MAFHWYVLRSKPHKEFQLFDQVLARGFECFFPRVNVNPVNPRSAKVRPFFPNYLFVKADIELEGINIFKWLPCSSGLVSFGGNPASIPDQIIEALNRKIDLIQGNGGLRLDGLKPGVKVQVVNGPFDGYEGIFDSRLDSYERVRILINSVHARKIPLDLSVGQILLAEK